MKKIKCLLLPLLLLTTACAGEEVAQKQSLKAARLVGDLQQHMAQSVESYSFDRSQEYRLVDEYLINRANDDALVRTHVATWQAAGRKESQDLFKATSSLAGLPEIRNSAPFIVITPPPAFTSPKLSSDQLKSLTTRFTKLGSPMAPSERLAFLLKLFDKAGKAYAEANKAAAADKVALAPAAAIAKADVAVAKVDAAAAIKGGPAATPAMMGDAVANQVPAVIPPSIDQIESVETNAAIFGTAP